MSSVYNTPGADGGSRNAASHSLDIPAQYAYKVSAQELSPHDSPRPVQRDQLVTSFRGEDWFFKGVSRKAYGSSEGRISVSRTCPDAYTTSNGQQDCPHMWHVNGVDTQEYYPSVFGLYLGLENGEDAR